MAKKSSIYNYLALTLFSVLAGWWLYLRLGESSDDAKELFSACYGLMALFGAFVGLKTSKLWGGYKSLIGRSVLFLSLGLLAQEFGQISYSLYTVFLDKEIPYPSIGDLGYAGSIFLYAYGLISLGRALSIRFTSKTFGKNIFSVFLPLAMLVVSYVEFLRDYSFEGASKLVVALDFGYPFGQAIYVSMAILVFFLSRKYLGGKMRPSILAIIFALIIQYASDFTFLFQTNRGTWTTAGINDFLYLVSYLAMTTAIIKLYKVNETLLTAGDQTQSSEEAS